MINTITFSRHQGAVPRSTSMPTKESAQGASDSVCLTGNSCAAGSITITSKRSSNCSAEAALAAADKLLKKADSKPVVDIKDVQAELTSELADIKVKYLHTDAFGELNGRLATNEELTAMIESFQDESQIPFGYIKDGCYARAHMMDESFRQHGINFAKMFVRGDLAAQNEHMSARWWYHVAPLVFVDDGQGNPDPKIIDPGLSDKPMDPEEWVRAMNQGPSIEVDLVDPEQYYPRRFTKPDSFAESLPPAVSRLQNYSRRLYNIREEKGQHLGEYVKPTWDKPGCGGDFEVDGERKTIFPEGVNTSKTRIYFGRSENGGTLIELEPQLPELEISAAWENRPTDFDPYA